MNWYQHPSISQVWLCEQLYGDKSDKNRSKLSRKLRQANGQRLTEKELTRLEEIRQTLLKELSSEP